MRFKNIVFSLILSIGILHAKDIDNNVTWQIIHWPPFMTIEKNNVKGEYVELLNFIETNLPSYKHKRRIMPWSRVWHEIKYGKNTCNIFAFKNEEREEFTKFSVPFSIFSSNHLIMKESTAEKLGLDIKKPYSLAELLKIKSIKGVLDKSRSYSTKIDNILKENELTSNFQRKPFTAIRLLELLNINRVDYILEYPSVILNMAQNIKLKEDLVFIQIKEIPPFSYGYVACPKNQWGEQIITKIDNIIIKNRGTKQYQDMIELMVSSDIELKLMREIYPNFIKSYK